VNVHSLAINVMNLKKIKVVVFFISFLIIFVIIWNGFHLYKEIKQGQMDDINIWALNQKEILSAPLDRNLSALQYEVLNTKNKLQTVLVYKDDNRIETSNIKDNDNIDVLIKKFKNENEPIKINYTNEKGKIIKVGILYYGNSTLIKKLKYFPFLILILVFLYASVVYYFVKVISNNEKNKLWVGMAKETAHQIGTPIFGLMGWIELLKLEDINENYVIEIEKEVAKLKIVSERFSKIGSEPILEKVNVCDVIMETHEYFENRLSKSIIFKFNKTKVPLYVNMNKDLFKWVLENLIINAIDAMKGKGKLEISINYNKEKINVLIEDEGKGIDKRHFNEIFKTGYTTKKRGWGIGLSVSKRIIEIYHKGIIKVLKSKINKGTSIQITLKRLV